MAGAAVPERIRWAVETLAVAPGDRLLEIGCGGGAAVALICPLLSGGHLTAIDRSATMTARAAQRNAEHVQAGRATVLTTPFRASGLPAEGPAAGPFDTIFAINVNLFWTGPARDELALARELLAPGGTLRLYYEAPGGRSEEITGRVAATLVAGGWSAQEIRSPSGMCVLGRPS